MRILKVDPGKPDKEVIEKAAKVLELGGLVIYPTETLYGIGANILDQNALGKVFEAKGRTENKPSSIAFKDLKQAGKFVEITAEAEKIAKKFLPGPLTIILQAKFAIDDRLGGGKMAIRIPDNYVALEILKRINFPITATSANRSGGPNPTSSRIAIDQIGESADLIIDSGECKIQKPSTVIDLSEGKIVIVREGAISKEEIFSSIQ